jgi:hypothetical protein
LLMGELRKAPSVLRLTYLADVEPPWLVNARLNALKKRIKAHWKKINRYQLTIETEVYWRHGGPVSQGGRGQ